LDRYMASNDPAFEEKAAEIIALYMDPPQHAAVFCVDEKTAIQCCRSPRGGPKSMVLNTSGTVPSRSTRRWT
jgi:hypothetical protein